MKGKFLIINAFSIVGPRKVGEWVNPPLPISVAILESHALGREFHLPKIRTCFILKCFWICCIETWPRIKNQRTRIWFLFSYSLCAFNKSGKNVLILYEVTGISITDQLQRSHHTLPELFPCLFHQMDIRKVDVTLNDYFQHSLSPALSVLSLKLTHSWQCWEMLS